MGNTENLLALLFVCDDVKLSRTSAGRQNSICCRGRGCCSAPIATLCPGWPLAGLSSCPFSASEAPGAQTNPQPGLSSSPQWNLSSSSAVLPSTRPTVRLSFSLFVSPCFWWGLPSDGRRPSLLVPSFCPFLVVRYAALMSLTLLSV